MTSASVPTDAPVLNWSRAKANRRKMWLLAALTLMALIPFVWGVSYMAARWLAVTTSPHAVATRSEIRREEEALRSATDLDAESRRAWEEVIAKKRAGQVGSSEDRFYEFLILIILVQSGALGLLFWSMAAWPTAKLLVEAGASPAGESEKGARQILDALANAAGMPAPKLYLIESGVPNAFSGGLGPGQSMIAVTRGLLYLLSPEEIEAVFAHELSHIGNEDFVLNSGVASIALFLRAPYLLFRRGMRATTQINIKPKRSPWRLLLSPVGIYILVVAPVLAAAIRASMSRGREYRADADAVQLTGSPRGLLLALAKLGGSGTGLTDVNRAFAHYYFCSPVASGGTLDDIMECHPPVAERIHRLMSMPGAISVEVVKDAVEIGRQYTREHPLGKAPATREAPDELTAYNRGNPMGRVFRVLAPDSIPVYESPTRSAAVLAWVRPGALIVAFDDPGKMRQVNTTQQTFGYVEHTVKLVLIEGLIPAEVYDPVARAAAEAKLPPLNLEPRAHRIPVPLVKPQPEKLTFTQILGATAFAVIVFAGVFFALMKFGS
jgi:heat shock protein HtpX